MVDLYQDHIIFDAQHGSWKVEESMEISKSTKASEIAQCISKIRNVSNTKAYSYLGIKTDVIDQFLSTVKIKSLDEAIATIGGSVAKKAVASASPDKKLEPIALSYLIAKAFASAGIRTFP